MTPQDQPSILWITPKWPFPCEDGARVATINLLKNLSRLHSSIHLLALVGHDEQIQASDQLEAKSQLGVQHVTLLKRSPTPRGALRYLSFMSSLLRDPRLPVTMAPFADPHLQEKLNAFIAQHRWDYAVYDGLHAAATSYQKGRYVQPPSFGAVIYRAHNFETALWEQNASPVSRLQRLNWIKRGGALLISKQVKNFESSLALTSQGVATVSAEDAESFKQIKYKINAFSVPIGQDFDSQLSPILPIADSNIPLLFIGRMDWPPNAEGLKWFLNSVWPKAIQQRPNLVLTIAGSGNSNWLRSYAHLPRLKLLGRVAHVHPVYNACWATIIPIRYGSGTRVKAIESCRLGRVCISTQAGVEGLGFTAGAQYIQAESAEDWIQALTKVDYPTCKTMGHQAFLFINKNYNGTTLAEKFSRLCFGTKPGSNHS